RRRAHRKPRLGDLGAGPRPLPPGQPGARPDAGHGHALGGGRGLRVAHPADARRPRGGLGSGCGTHRPDGAPAPLRCRGARAAPGKDVSPVPFHCGEGGWDPARDHELRLIDGDGSEVGLELTPRATAAAYVKKTLWLDSRTWLPARLELVEATDDVVTFVF